MCSVNADIPDVDRGIVLRQIVRLPFFFLSLPRDYSRKLFWAAIPYA